MASGTRLAKEKQAKGDDPSMANQISMSALTSLPKEHHQSLSGWLRSVFASLQAKIDTAHCMVTDFSE